MDITVLICTHNRCELLRQALGSIAASQLPPGVEWEIVVVDNNSSDGTNRVVAEANEAHPGRFRYLLEPVQGKSVALNAGIREARGGIIAFTDDDVTVAPDWLARLTANLDGGEWAGAGGRVLPVWRSPKPKWLPDFGGWDGVSVQFDPGGPAGELKIPPIGANMAYRKEVFAACGGFSPGLGPIAGRLSFAVEDTEFGSRVVASGRRLRYEPEAVVYHPVAPHRARRAFVLKWFFAKGRSDAQLNHPHDKPCLAGVPLRLFGRIFACAVRCLPSASSKRRMRWAAFTASVAGAIAGSWELAHRPHRGAANSGGESGVRADAPFPPNPGAAVDPGRIEGKG
jgi:glycosyltransferase involved in cell wall biosynthesis